MPKRMKRRKKEGLCKYLYIDVFGYPFCTLKSEKALKCEYCEVSQEYKEMIAQQKSEEYKRLCKGSSVYKTPSIYRCTRLDHLADKYGHLPERMRPELKKGLYDVTIGV